MTSDEPVRGGVTVAESTAAGLEAADDDAGRALEQARRLSDLLDEAFEIPGTGYRIGLDPLVGILPVVGDLPASAVAVYIVVEAAYLGVPKATLARMVLNVAVDTVFGSLPVVGPVFDAVWKANARNVALLEQRLDEPGSSRRDRRLLAAMGLAILALVVGLALSVGALLGWVAAELGLL